MLAYIEIISSLCCKFTTFSANLQEKTSKTTKKSLSASIIKTKISKNLTKIHQRIITNVRFLKILVFQ